MSTTQEEWTKMPDGKELYTKTWKPSGERIATIIFLHGFSDHCNRYAKFFPMLAEAGVAVHAFDQRGWGRSVKTDAERGLCGDTSQVMDDITFMIKSHLPSPVPLFLMGQSMGGQETLYWACAAPMEIRQQVSGFIALAPWIELHPKTQPSWLKVRAGKLASMLLPRMQLKNELDMEVLSHDEADNISYRDDPLCHDTGTLEGFAGALGRAESLATATITPTDYDGFRLLVIHGTGDRCTSHVASKKFFERAQVKEKHLKLYEGVYHNLHVEPEREQLLADILQFIKDASTAGKVQPQSKL